VEGEAARDLSVAAAAGGLAAGGAERLGVGLAAALTLGRGC
jgi:hypothetical protein